MAGKSFDRRVLMERRRPVCSSRSVDVEIVCSVHVFPRLIICIFKDGPHRIEGRYTRCWYPSSVQEHARETSQGTADRYPCDRRVTTLVTGPPEAHIVTSCTRSGLWVPLVLSTAARWTSSGVCSPRGSQGRATSAPTVLFPTTPTQLGWPEPSVMQASMKLE